MTRKSGGSPVPRKRTTAPKPPKETWEGRFTADVIGPQIAHWRLRLSVTADELVSRMGTLGHPMKRSVLSAIESGRRDGVSVAEVLIIAQALQVPPIALIVPLGRADEVEIRDGKRVPTVDVYRWFVGEGGLSAEPQDALSDASFNVSWVREHEAAVSRLRAALRNQQDADDDLAAALNDSAPSEQLSKRERAYRAAISQVQTARVSLRHYRRAITDYGDTPPPLDVELAQLVDRERTVAPTSERMASTEDREALDAALRRMRGEQT